MPRIIDKEGNLGFFGKVSWANFVDWLVTVCLGSIIAMTASSLGGVRPDTLMALWPLYSLLLGLHGLWLLVNSEHDRQLSYIPLWFVPALVWMLYSVFYVTPVPWLGWYEWIYALQAFIVLWVLCNNVRTRAHLWALMIMSLFPAGLAVFNGFYQFFQDPTRIVGALTDYRLELHSQFLGRATGVFADPFSFAAFLLVLLPILLIVASVRRLPTILRVLSFYVALMFMGAIVFTQVYWAGVLMIVVVGLVPWFCLRRFKQKVMVSLLSVLAVASSLFLLVTYHPLLEAGFQRGLTEDGEGVRTVLWKEALAMTAENPVTGVGAGAYGLSFEQSPEVSLAERPESPHNDYLLILSQLGVVGTVLFLAPVLLIFFKSWRTWLRQPYGIKLRDQEGIVMPPQRFFLSIGIAGSIAFALCMGMTFVFYVPAILLYGVLLLSLLIKNTYRQRFSIGSSPVVRFAYFALTVGAGFSSFALAYYKLESRSLELMATRQLDHLVEMRVHLSGRADLLDEVIVNFEDALIVDSGNVDARLGLSSALCLLYYRNPAEFGNHATRAVESARRGTEDSPEYWRAWAQLGVAHSFNAEPELAESAFLRALDLAPNSGHAHYYYAAFIGVDSSRREEALSYVRQALQINPGNAAARRLEQKLRIL